MDNIDIVVLSTIVTTLFAIFIGLTIKELNNVSENKTPSMEAGPRADMIKFVGRLFDSPSLSKEDANKKLDVYKTVTKVIADMESDGVYFPDEIKKELVKKREELWCEYSNLPSVKAYED